MGSLPRSSQFVTIFVTDRPYLRLSFILIFFVAAVAFCSFN